MPVAILAGAIAPFLPDEHEGRSALEGGAVGGVLGSLLK
jgi:hypothetical protein